jgi:hypothetical protein
MKTKRQVIIDNLAETHNSLGIRLEPLEYKHTTAMREALDELKNLSKFIEAISNCQHPLQLDICSADNGYGGVIRWCPECGALSWRIDGGYWKRNWELPKEHRDDCAYRTNSGYEFRCPKPPLKNER